MIAEGWKSSLYITTSLPLGSQGTGSFERPSVRSTLVGSNMRCSANSAGHRYTNEAFIFLDYRCDERSTLVTCHACIKDRTGATSWPTNIKDNHQVTN